MKDQSSPHGYLIDMDGVLYRGKQPIPHARDFLKRLQQSRIPFLLLTNHSCFTPLQLAQKLCRMGIEIEIENFYTSAMATAEWLRRQGAQRVFAIGEEGLLSALHENDIEVGSVDVTHVVIGLDRHLSYEKLKLAARLITAGAKFIATNPDPTYPVEDGEAPECGLLLGALQNVTGVLPTVIGKPEPIVYQQAAHRMELPLISLTMIGDRLDTDISGALGVGAQAILMLTGHATRAMLVDSLIQPSRILENLSEIEFPALLPHLAEISK